MALSWFFSYTCLDWTWLLFPCWCLNHHSVLKIFFLIVANRQHGWKHIFAFDSSQWVLFFLIRIPWCWCSLRRRDEKRIRSHLVLAVARGALPQAGDGSSLLSTWELHTLRPISPEALSLSVKWGSDASNAPSVRNYGTASKADLQKFFFLLFDKSHYEAYCQYRNGNTFCNLHKTKKKKNNAGTKYSFFWVLRTFFHSLDFSWTSSVSRIRCILAFYQGINAKLFSQKHMLAWFHPQLLMPIQWWCGR